MRGICYVKQLILAAAVTMTSSVCALLTAIAIAFLLDHTGHSMSWFSNTYLLFGLFVAPSCCAILSTCVVAKKLFYKVPVTCMIYFVCTVHSAVYAIDGVCLSMCLSCFYSVKMAQVISRHFSLCNSLVISIFWHHIFSWNWYKITFMNIYTVKLPSAMLGVGYSWAETWL